jgi:hypothetical protein
MNDNKPKMSISGVGPEPTSKDVGIEKELEKLFKDCSYFDDCSCGSGFKAIDEDRLIPAIISLFKQKAEGCINDEKIVVLTLAYIAGFDVKKDIVQTCKGLSIDIKGQIKQNLSVLFGGEQADKTGGKGVGNEIRRMG